MYEEEEKGKQKADAQKTRKKSSGGQANAKAQTVRENALRILLLPYCQVLQASWEDDAAALVVLGLLPFPHLVLQALAPSCC